MSMTNKEAFILHAVIGKFEKEDKVPTKFAWALMRTKKKLKALVDSMNELRQPSEEIQEYEKKRIALCEEYSEKDEDGKPVIENQNYKILEGKREALDEEIKKLRDENKEAFDAQEAKMKELDELMEEEADVEVYKVKEQYLPDTISVGDLQILEPMIECDTE